MPSASFPRLCPHLPLAGVCRCGGRPALPGPFAVPHRLMARRRRCSSGGPTPPRLQPPTSALCALARIRLQPPQAVSSAASPVLSLGLTPEARASFSTQPPSASGISGRGAQGHDCPFFLLQTGCCAFL